MLFNSRAVALLLASLVAVLTTAFLWLLPDTSPTALAVTFVLAFSSTYLLVWVIFEFLVFKEISEIYHVLDKLREKDFSFMTEGVQKQKKDSNPLRRINREIYTYALNRQKEIEDLRDMETFRREFLADVSHELKTPIFAAQGFVHTLLDGAVNDKKVRDKFLKRAAKSLDRLDDLIHDLLTLSQIETGQSKMHFEHFNVLELAREVMDQFENKAEKKKLSLSFDKDYDQEIFVYADSEWIYRVLLNLVSNAIKYTDSGEVVVSLQTGTSRVKISIRDTGLGIPQDYLNRVFERFFRVDKSRSKERGGTGLGLAIVKHIMEAHNSKVMVRSVSGEGSVFSFELPLNESGMLESLEETEQLQIFEEPSV